MESKMNLKQLAKLLNISISTVSKSLHNSPEISAETKRRVQELAELHNYVPNVFAQNLKTNKSQTIGMVIPEISHQFFTQVLEGAVSETRKKGYNLTICISNESLEQEQRIIDELIRSQVDGVAISLSEETFTLDKMDHLKKLKKHGISLVLFDRVDPNLGCDTISINDSINAELTIYELLSRNRKKILYLSGIPNTSVNERRKDGYVKAIDKVHTPFILEVDYKNFPHSEILKFIKTNNIDAILASDELTAIQIMRYLKVKRYNIPDEISIIGFSIGNLGEHYLPSLSAIDQKAEEQGRCAVEILIDRIEGKLQTEPLAIQLEANIIHRESTLMKKPIK